MEFIGYSKYKQILDAISSSDYKEYFRFLKNKNEIFEADYEAFTEPYRALFEMLKKDFQHLTLMRLSEVDIDYLNIPEEDIIRYILDESSHWNISLEDYSGSQAIKVIVKRLKNSKSLVELIDKVLKKHTDSFTFQDVIEMFLDPIIAGRNLNQHAGEKERDEWVEQINKDKSQIWISYQKIFESGIIAVLPQIFATMYYLSSKIGRIFKNDIGSLELLWKEFPEIHNPGDTMLKIIDDLTDNKEHKYIDYQGRVSKLMNELKTSRIITIYGEGGLGKTELVKQALVKLRTEIMAQKEKESEVSFTSLYPFTFKSSEQGEYAEDTVAGLKSVEHKGWHAKIEFSEVVRLLADESKINYDRSSSKERVEIAIKYLLNNSIFVIIDNTEVIEEDSFNDELKDFLELFQEQCKNDTESRIVITSRIKPRDRPGVPMKMKYLNPDEMKELAKARAEWLYQTNNKEKTPHVNISADYNGWGAFSNLLSNELKTEDLEVVGHPLFVFTSVYELMYNNPKKLPFHQIIDQLITEMKNSDDSKIQKLFDYITSKSIDYIKEIKDWAPILLDMIKAEIFSAEDIKNYIQKHNLKIHSNHIIERLLILDIVRNMTSDKYNVYEFKTARHSKMLHQKIIDSTDAVEEKVRASGILKEYNLLVEYISLQHQHATEINYIILERRYLDFVDRAINLFDSNWIKMVHGLVNESCKMWSRLHDKDNTIFFDSKSQMDVLEDYVKKYLIESCTKLCWNFDNMPKPKEYKLLVKLLGDIEMLNDDSFDEVQNSLFTILAEKTFQVYSAETHSASLSLLNFMEKNISLSLNSISIIQVINCLIDKIEPERKIKCYEIISTLEVEEIDKKRIFDNTNTICRELKESSECLNILIEANKPTFFDKMFRKEDVESNNPSRFDIIEIPLNGEYNMLDSSMNFLENGIEYCISVSPNNLQIPCNISAQVFHMGLQDNTGIRIYGLYLSHNKTSKIIPANRDSLGEKEFSKDHMFLLLDSIEFVQEDVTRFFNEIISKKLSFNGHKFSWTQWKTCHFTRKTKIVQIIQELSKGKWRVERKGHKLFIIRDNPRELIFNPLMVNISPNKDERLGGEIPKPKVNRTRKTILHDISKITRTQRNSANRPNVKEEEE